MFSAFVMAKELVAPAKIKACVTPVEFTGASVRLLATAPGLVITVFVAVAVLSAMVTLSDEVGSALLFQFAAVSHWVPATEVVPVVVLVQVVCA